VRSDDLLRAQQQRWWICVAAGLVVLIVVTVAVPWPYGWGWGVLASTATTAAATATHYASGLLTDRPSEPDLFAADAAVASVWLSFATVLAAAVLVPLRGVRRPGPRPVVRRLVPVAALVVTAAVALTISGTGVPGGAALSLVQQQQAAFDARYAPLRHALTAEQAQRVATTVILVMPLTWRGGPGRKPGDGVVSPDAVLSRPACEPLIRERFLAAGEPHLRATGRYDVSSRTETTGLKYTTITVTTFSYDAPVGERILTAARDARRQCPAFQVAGETVRIDFQVRPGNPPDLGELSFRYDSTLSASVAGQEITGTNAYVMLSVGYTVITVYMAAVGQPLDEELLQKVAAGVENALLSLR
jgi:hypothetical protein